MEIDTLEAIQAGGTTQWIRIRGADASNPVLLLIQQGPGLLGSGATTITFPGGPCRIRPVPTGDLEAAFQATGAPDIIAYSAELDPAANPRASDPQAAGP